mgnify:CR=1 FL=1
MQRNPLFLFVVLFLTVSKSPLKQFWAIIEIAAVSNILTSNLTTVYGAEYFIELDSCNKASLS